MSHFPWRRLFALVTAAGLGAFLLLRLGLAFWATSPPRGDALLRWGVETTLAALILLATAAACGWLAARVRKRDREQAHLEHLAEVGLLAGGITHEIRNTLNAMHSQVALLRKQVRSDDQEQTSHRIRQIERAVVELDELVDEFLAVARPAKDQPEDVELGALIRGVLDFAALDLEQAAVEVRLELDPALPSLCLDAGKLKRALLNLIVNARQAMPEGGTLTVRARCGARDELRIEVSDTGCGIPVEDRPRIFQTFFSTKPDGTGLGLALVKRTVEDLGGRITFDSEVGRGTTFRITLPLAMRWRERRTGPPPRPAALASENTR